MPTLEVRTKAAEWLATVICTEDLSSVLPGLQAWLREDPSHRAAFAGAQRAWRLAKPLIRAGQPDAGSAEVEAFFDALEEERVRSSKEFANS